MSLFSPPDIGELRGTLSNIAADAYRDYTVALENATALLDAPDGGADEESITHLYAS
jgi:hypothetical protein